MNGPEIISHDASAHSTGSPRFLVIRSGAIGDTLMATPLLRSLRRSFPGAYIAALTSAGALDVLHFNPHLDEVLPLKNRHLPYFFSLEKRRLARHFRSMGLDAVLSLESNSDFTDLACRFGARQLVTYDPNAACGSTKHVAPLPGEHSSATHLRAGASVGAAAAGPEMELYFPDAAGEAVEAKLAKMGVAPTDRIIGVHAGWGSRQQDPDDTRLRSWPADRFAEIVRHASDSYNAAIVLTGTQLDRPLNEEIARRAGVSVVNAAGQFSLLETAALISRMSVYVSIDSGPAHIAAAVGTPVVTLWGPGILTATQPIAGLGPVRTLYSPPPCAPCYGAAHMKSCTSNICMKNISVDEVRYALADLMAGGAETR